MVDNQHKKITGYRDLSAQEIAAMNQLKEIGEMLGDAVAGLQNTPGIDQRWVAIGKTDLQTGIMALIRSVAQPTTF